MKREPNFDRVARIYRWAEYCALGRTLERTREYFLPQLRGCRRVLAIGDGDGRFLASLLRENQAMHAVAVDTSEAMLRLLRNRCGAQAQTMLGSALATTVQPDTDLVVTHFFLDCLHQAEVETLVGRVSAALRPGALWVVSEFGLPKVRWMRPLAVGYIRGLYLAFRLLTGLRVTRLPDPQRALHNAGFALIARQEFLHGLLYTELWTRT